MMDRSWLARTEESVIDPKVEIVDPHHHLWEVQTRYGRYRLEDLLVDTRAGHRVVQTVFIDCGAEYRTEGPEHLRPLGETEYVADRAATSAAAATSAPDSGGAEIAAIVSHADLTLGAAVEEVLSAHATLGRGRFRGVRHSGARAGDEAVPVSRVEPPAGLYRQADFQAGARTLAAMGFSFEAWQYHHQLADVAALARAVPELPIIVNHLGGPVGVGRFAGRWDEVQAETRKGLADIATCDNTFLKLGGVGMTRFGPPWVGADRPPTSDEVVAVWGDLIGWAIDAFGPGRCMFESNYPVDGATVGYVVLWNAFKKLASDYGPDERHQLLAGTARRVYLLDPAGQPGRGPESSRVR